jgi:probable F420-dependent oxidoreductase
VTSASSDGRSSVTSARPFRFAVQATAAESASDWRDLARNVEDLGYSTLFHADHYVGPGPASEGSLLGAQQLAPIASMAAAAAWTTTLRIGCRVFCSDYHVPAVLAKEAATLDFMSDGRLELGIGAGWHADEYNAMGLEFREPGDRVDTLVEVVALLKAFWTGEQIDLDGAHVHVAGYSGLPRPVQDKIPLMIGGSKKRVLSFAAREARIVSMNNVPWADPDPIGEAERRIGYIRAAARDSFDDLELESAASFVEVTDDARSVLEQASPGLRDADPKLLADHPNVLVGSIAEMVDCLEQRRERLGLSYISVNGKDAVAFAPVVARLSGR